MADPVKICNLALSWMGQNSINSLTDDQTEAEVMNANYALSRDLVLEDHAWTFATERRVLPKTTESVAFGKGNKFLIPSTALRVHRCYRPTNNLQTSKFQNADWVREGKYIIAPEESVWVVLIMQVTNTDLFSPGFVHALAARLAADTAMTLTENKSLKNDMEALYQDKLANAGYLDGSQGRTEVVRSSALTGSRKR